MIVNKYAAQSINHMRSNKMCRKRPTLIPQSNHTNPQPSFNSTRSGSSRLKTAATLKIGSKNPVHQCVISSYGLNEYSFDNTQMVKSHVNEQLIKSHHHKRSFSSKKTRNLSSNLDKTVSSRTKIQEFTSPGSNLVNSTSQSK